jgi:hypothetical protein
MNPNSKNPAAREAGRAPNSFCLAAERSEHTQASAKTQGNETVSDVRAALLRDFVFEALAPLESDAAAARLSLKNDDDAGARYHLKRVVECVESAAATFRELETVTGKANP